MKNILINFKQLAYFFTVVPELGFQIHGFQKYFSSNDKVEYDFKIEKKVKNGPHLIYFFEKFIFQVSSFIAFANNLF